MEWFLVKAQGQLYLLPLCCPNFLHACYMPPFSSTTDLIIPVTFTNYEALQYVIFSNHLLSPSLVQIFSSALLRHLPSTFFAHDTAGKKLRYTYQSITLPEMHTALLR